MARTPLSGFHQALENSTAELHELTLRGDAVERVWAAWALALREGRGAHFALLTVLESELNAGTRALVVTVVAGWNDAATLRTIAARDPAAIVRETACQCLARIAGHELATIDFLMFRMVHDPAPQVRAAVVAELPASAPPIAFERCAQLLRDPEPGVRQAAARRLALREDVSKDVVEAFASVAVLDSDWCVRILAGSGGIGSRATWGELAPPLHSSGLADASKPFDNAQMNETRVPTTRQRFSKAELDEILAKHLKWVNSFCCDGASAELENADLRGADLREADLRWAGLSGVDLSFADLSRAVLINADLSHAQLRYANLRDADLRAAELDGADLGSADLQGAIF